MSTPGVFEVYTCKNLTSCLLYRYVMESCVFTSQALQCLVQEYPSASIGVSTIQAVSFGLLQGRLL